MFKSSAKSATMQQNMNRKHRGYVVRYILNCVKLRLSIL